jgi:hypothetical protein
MESNQVIYLLEKLSAEIGLLREDVKEVRVKHEERLDEHDDNFREFDRLKYIAMGVGMLCLFAFDVALRVLFH